MIEESTNVIVSQKQLHKNVIIIAIVALAVGIAFFVGLSIGHSTGYTLGFDEGQSTEYSSGFGAGNRTGYASGFLTGVNEGYDIGRFEFYYVKPTQQYGVDNLVNDLNGLDWTKPYQEDVFDCSEMSANLERYLENEGWHTIILTGNSPFGSGSHAWLLVETSVDEYMPVESTNIGVVFWKDPYFDNYFEYDYDFEIIQEALAHSETEFDWWQSG